jgi:maltose O-acetyltransferase
MVASFNSKTEIMDVLKHYLYQRLRIWKYGLLSDLKEIKGKALIKQPVLFTGKGKVSVGTGVVIGTHHSPHFFNGYSYIEARHNSSVIEIGDRVWTNNNLAIICNGSSIVIEKDTLIGLNVEIMDSDFHNLSPLTRRSREPTSSPVLIESNVWIGSNVRILKGVTVGKNSVIANGSIVVKSIPENVIAAGIPAKVVKSLEDEKDN